MALFLEQNSSGNNQNQGPYFLCFFFFPHILYKFYLFDTTQFKQNIRSSYKLLNSINQFSYEIQISKNINKVSSQGKRSLKVTIVSQAKFITSIKLDLWMDHSTVLSNNEVTIADSSSTQYCLMRSLLSSEKYHLEHSKW